MIGIGNPLRGDDGVGALLAEQVGGRSVHQLTPELAADLAPLQRVLFIDAWLTPEHPGPPPQPRLDTLPAQTTSAGSGGSHHLDPGQLLAITAALYGRAPTASWLRIPGHSFSHGKDFSRGLQASLPAGRLLLRRWLVEV